MAESTIWYRVGYALEKARAQAPPADDGANGARPQRSSRSADDGGLDWPSTDDLIASGLAALAGKVLDAWRPARKVTLSRLIRAGVAGAAAALLLDLVRPLLHGRAELPQLGGDTGARLLAGAGQGLLYGAVVEPRVPGHPVVKGAVFGLAEYMAHPAGGLSRILGPHAPGGRLPVLGDFLGDVGEDEREYVELLTFGVALALLYGTAPSLDDIEALLQDD